eukprot:TRINITY_DN26472_c0_g1_i1.p1 TRINITY_DN26472_c0_g1~~TRINITY_DN26472_c0_g1_i1.p1  ORF type:complete len:732 (-),score=177.73 TRINITY_DN26472_c0_g1_i1:129-2324(-)
MAPETVAAVAGQETLAGTGATTPSCEAAAAVAAPPWVTTSAAATGPACAVTGIAAKAAAGAAKVADVATAGVATSAAVDTGTGTCNSCSPYGETLAAATVMDSSPSSRLRSELEGILARHRADLERCLATWAAPNGAKPGGFAARGKPPLLRPRPPLSPPKMAEFEVAQEPASSTSDWADDGGDGELADTWHSTAVNTGDLVISDLPGEVQGPRQAGEGEVRFALQPDDDGSQANGSSSRAGTKGASDPGGRASSRKSGYVELAARFGYSEGKFASNPAGALRHWRKKIKTKALPFATKTKKEKYKYDFKHADDYLTERTRKIAEDHETLLERFVTSRAFEFISVSLILLNTIMIGVQIQYMSFSMMDAIGRGERFEKYTPASFQAVHILFCVLFCIELALRWTTDGLYGFFLTKDRWWNVVDVFLILVTVVELLVDLLKSKDPILQLVAAFRVLRVVRIIRVVKTIRTAPFLKEMRLIVLSILGSLGTFFWVLLVMSLVFYVFGLALTWVSHRQVIDMAKTMDRTDIKGLEGLTLLSYFGTVDRSMLSLFMSISGGRDWVEYWNVFEESTVGQFVLGFFMSFSFFAALQVVNGVFVESAMRSSERDREFVIQERLSQKEKYMHSMRQLFEEIDADNSGSITQYEFQQQIEDERAIAYFNSLKLDVSEAITLFTLLDVDQSGQVDIEEFLVGCEKLMGEARSLDMAVLQYEVRWLTHSFLEFADFVEERLM